VFGIENNFKSEIQVLSKLLCTLSQQWVHEAASYQPSLWPENVFFKEFNFNFSQLSDFKRAHIV
jgi:hypothetical protein